MVKKTRPDTSPPAADAEGRRSRDPKRTTAAILTAAVKEFAENGYGGARTDNIAARAGVNKRMLYHYFGSKEGLYVASLEGVFDRIRTAEHQLRLSERDPVEAIRELVTFTWSYYLRHPEFLSLLNTEDLLRARYLKRAARIRQLNSPLVEQLAIVLESGAEGGVFRRNVDPLDLYLSIAALGFFRLSNQWTLTTAFGRDIGLSAEASRWGQHMVDVILSYLRPPDPKHST